ncbi:hypothetical protein D3C81_2038840 [compost metagenome]
MVVAIQRCALRGEVLPEQGGAEQAQPGQGQQQEAQSFGQLQPAPGQDGWGQLRQSPGVAVSTGFHGASFLPSRALISSFRGLVWLSLQASCT